MDDVTWIAVARATWQRNRPTLVSQKQTTKLFDGVQVGVLLRAVQLVMHGPPIWVTTERMCFASS
jgi:hypothetical protein